MKKVSFKFLNLLFLAFLLCSGFALQTAQAQVTKNDAILEINHRWPKYVRGSWDLDETINPVVSCTCYRYAGSGVAAQTTGRPNFIWAYTNAMIVYDMDDPSTAANETTSVIDVFPIIANTDNPALHENENQRFTVYATNNLTTPESQWTVAAKSVVFTKGWREDTRCDDYLTRWKLGGEFRYVGVKRGGPGALILGGSFVNIDTVGIPPVVQTPVIANFQADPTAGFVPLNVQFTDKSTGNPTSWAYEFGDGDVSSVQSPKHTYKNSGIFTVKLTASNSAGADEETQINLINALAANPPVANFSADPLTGLAPLKVNFEDTSTGNVTSWAWDFGDGNISEDENPTNDYQMGGIFSVGLTVGGKDGAANALKRNLISVIPASGPVAEFSADPTTGFAPLDVEFADKSTGDPTNWTWEFGDGDISEEQNPSHTYESFGFFNVSLIVSNANGTDVAAKLSLIYALPKAAPRAAFTQDKTTGFVPLDVQFTDQSAGNVSNRSWFLGDGTTSEEQNPAHIYQTAGIYSVNQVISGPDGVSVLDKPNLVIAMAPDSPEAAYSANVTTGLAPLEVEFTDKSTGKPGSWAWDFGDGSTSRNQNPAYTYQTPGIYTVKLTVSGSNGADLEIKTNLISVMDKGKPTAGFTANPTSGFAPLEVQFTDVTAGDPTSWAWVFGDGNTSSEQSPVNTYNKAGFFTVTLTASNKDGASVETKTNLIDVFGAGGPRADFSASVTSGFAPLSVEFTDLSTGKPTSWAWEFGDGNTSPAQNPNNTYNVAGLFTVGLTVSNSAGASIEIKTNLINAIGEGGPIADFKADPTSGFAPLSVIFTDISAGSPSTWTWDFGNGNTSSLQNPSNVYNVAGLYTVELNVSNGKGASTETKTNIINAMSKDGPVAAFEASTTSGLAPLAVNFTDLSTGEPTTWSWAFGNGGVSSVQNPSATYNVAGLYSPSLTVSNSAGANSEVKNNLINVLAVGGPVAEFKASVTAGTAPLAVKFTDLTEGAPNSWAWTFGDGGVSAEQNPSHTYNVQGFYTVKLVASNSNGAATEIKTNLITVLGAGAPVAAFSATPTAGLAPLTVQFTDLSQGGITSWSWTFGDGGISSDQNPSHTYKTANIFNVKLIVSGSEGSDNESKTIIVEAIPVPQADFEASPLAGAAPLNVRFTDLSQPEGHIDSWSWDFGDGGTSRDSNPSHNYRRAGIFTVKLTISGASGADIETKTNVINVIPPNPPQADFLATPTAGLKPLAVVFEDISQPEGGIDSWLWDFGDGGSDVTPNPKHTYNREGIFSVGLTVSNSSGADIEKKTNLIQVGTGGVTADFSATPTFGLAPLTVSFTDLSQPEGTFGSWLWDFGDGATSIDQNPKHVYKKQGFFTVKLTVSNSDGASTEVKTNLIQVEGVKAPKVDFVASPTAGKAPLNVNFEDRSEPADSIASWLWDFGDGASATEQNPLHTYKTGGIFTVELTASNSGGAGIETKNNLIFVKSEDVPNAAFNASATAGEPPFDVTFTDLSEGDIGSWLWSFGDGATSSEQNPAHTYKSAGIFTVILGVSGPGGADSEKKVNLIGVFEAGSAEAQFTATPQIGIVPLTVSFTDNTAGEVSGWLWDFGDGATSDEQNPVHDYTTPGDYTVKLTVSGASNTSEVTKTNFIRVVSDESGSFAAFFDYEPVIGFSPVEVQFFDQTTVVDAEVDSWAWEFGDEGSSNEETPIHTYSTDSEQEFNVSLTVGVGGESDTFTIEKAVKVVAEIEGECQAIMSIKPDPINVSRGKGVVKAFIALSEGCLGTVDDIDCDSLELEGAKATSCTIRKGQLMAKFSVKDLEVEPGNNQVFTLTGETTEGDVFTATDTVDVK